MVVAEVVLRWQKVALGGWCFGGGAEGAEGH